MLWICCSLIRVLYYFFLNKPTLTATAYQLPSTGKLCKVFRCEVEPQKTTFECVWRPIIARVCCFSVGGFFGGGVVDQCFWALEGALKILLPAACQKFKRCSFLSSSSLPLQGNLCFLKFWFFACPAATISGETQQTNKVAKGCCQKKSPETRHTP